MIISPLQSPFPPRRKHLLHNAVYPLGDEEACKSKQEQARRDAPEPGEVPLVLLARNPYVHAPQTGDDVHWQHDGTEHGELAKDVVGLLGALVHANVDLGEVVLVGPGENPACTLANGTTLRKC